MGSNTGTNALTQAARSVSACCRVTMRDGRDDVFDSGGGLKKTVTIDTDRHAPAHSESATAPFDGSAVKSAFALLSQKVTKARCGGCIERD